MAVATKLSCALIVLLLHCQHSVSKPAPVVQNMWISMQAAFGFDSNFQNLFEKSNQKQLNPTSTANSATELAPTTTTSISAENVPTTTTNNSTGNVSTTTTSYEEELCPPIARTEVSLCSSTDAPARNYVMFEMDLENVEYLRLAHKVCSKQVADFEACKQTADNEESGSFAFLEDEKECLVSSYWRQRKFIKEANGTARQEVYFVERDDGDKCFTPNLTLIDENEKITLGERDLEELKAVNDCNKNRTCLRIHYICYAGVLYSMSYPFIYYYQDELKKCVTTEEQERLLKLEYIEHICKIYEGFFYDIRSENEQEKFFSYSASRNKPDDLIPVDVQYDPEDKLFKWKKTGIAVDASFWKEGYPTTDPEAESCVAVSQGLMINRSCDLEFTLFCLQTID